MLPSCALSPRTRALALCHSRLREDRKLLGVKEVAVVSNQHVVLRSNPSTEGGDGANMPPSTPPDIQVYALHSSLF